MSYRTLVPVAAAAVLLLGADWSGCQSALDKVRGRAGEASDRAASTSSASSSMESKKRELDSCRSNDAKGGGCRTLSDEYDGAQGRYQSAKRALDSALDDVDASVRSANRACEYPVSSSTTSSSSDPLCWLLQRTKGHVAPDKLMETCKKIGKSEEQCRACLAP
jgi:hypothetical protein